MQRKENDRITELGDLLGKQQKLLERAEQRVVLESSMKTVTIDDMDQVMLENVRHQERVESLEDENAEIQKVCDSNSQTQHTHAHAHIHTYRMYK